jgi:hypothetical protein
MRQHLGKAGFVGLGRRRWLSPTDRAALADASQQAAVAARNTKIAWSAPPTAAVGATGVTGWAAPISDPYRASHGALCRDVRQALTRADDVIVQSVSLCREETGLGGSVWVAAHWP